MEEMGVAGFRNSKFRIVIGFFRTVKDAKNAYYAVGGKEDAALRELALGRWRYFSDKAVAEAVTYGATERAYEDIPYPDAPRHERAIELALERCANTGEVIRWLDLFAGRDAGRVEAGARKLLEFVEAARTASSSENSPR